MSLYAFRFPNEKNDIIEAILFGTAHVITKVFKYICYLFYILADICKLSRAFSGMLHWKTNIKAEHDVK